MGFPDKTHIDYSFSDSVKDAYGYDVLTNITTLDNDNLLGLPGDGELTGPVSYDYDYDEFNRLERSNGYYVGPNDAPTKLLRQDYDLDMRYNDNQDITGKIQRHRQAVVTDMTPPSNSQWQTVTPTTYKLTYTDYAEGSYNTDGYSYAQPHAPRKITQEPVDDQGNAATLKQEKTIDYDADGNMTAIKQNIESPDNPLADEEMTLRRYRWDEEDRLRAVDLLPDNAPKRPEVANYTYDADGQRVVRYVPGRIEAVYSAHHAGDKDRLESFIYPSGLLTVKTLSLKDVQGPNDLGRAEVSTYTKHYYIGDQRVTSALGTTNNLGALCGDIFTNINGLNTQAMMQLMDAKTVTAAQALDEDYTAFDKVLSLPQPLLYNGTLPSCKRYHTPDNYRAYWFHPDHLGSSSYISNLSGAISQHMEYFPFGETLVEEHKNSNNSPYKFNGKELDDETGNYYYGARYYNPKTSIWLSVDPLAEKYPGWSPYNYTMNNPINLTDPDGRSVNNCTGCPDNANLNDKVVHKNHGELTYNGNYWEDSNGVNILDDVVIEATGAKQSYKEPDGVKIWKDFEGTASGENIGIQTGKSGSSINASTMASLGGNPTGAGYMSKTTKIMGLIAALISPISDLFGDEPSTKQNRNTNTARPVKKTNNQTKIQVTRYNIHSDPDGTINNVSIIDKDTFVNPGEVSHFAKERKQIQNKLDSIFPR